MKISVVIVTRNRKEDLICSINAYLRQTYPLKEIVVVDNGSTDGTKEEIPKLFPEVKYYWIPENFDIRSIILGVYWSDGEIIWRCDSDSYPESEYAFEQVVDILKKHPEIDIIATENIDVRRDYSVWDWYPLTVSKTNIPDGGYESPVFQGTGAAIRRKVFDTIGGFIGFGFEEYDFAARAIIAGFNIRYFPNIRVLHFASLKERNRPHRWLTTSEQFIRFSWRYFPFFRALGRTILIVLAQLLEGIAKGLKPSILIEGFLLMCYTIFKTVRTERMVPPKDKLKKITMGRSLFLRIIRNYIYMLSSRFKRRKK
ncbi:MAG: glycosyltransferase [Ignavibacteria bacterium]|nr:glycosyltransferase [Ignavibacteria bacterium]